MITKTMIKPSYWIETGVKIIPIKNVYLFKFDDDIQYRLEELLEQHKTNNLTSQEQLELEGIMELNEIFTLLNAKIIAQTNVK